MQENLANNLLQTSAAAALARSQRRPYRFHRIRRRASTRDVFALLDRRGARFAHERRAHSAVSHSKLEASTRTSSLAAPGVAPITHLRLVPIARDLARDAAAAVVGRGVNYLQLFGPAGTPGFNNPIVRPNDGSWSASLNSCPSCSLKPAYRPPTQTLRAILCLGIDRDPTTRRPLIKTSPGKAKGPPAFLQQFRQFYEGLLWGRRCAPASR